VLSQRHIDTIRAGKKLDSLDDGGGDGEMRRVPELSAVDIPADPHRATYLQKFREALSVALASLEARDCERMRLYYAEDHTLAEIGRELGEHESSVSRNLERVRGELRATVEGLLRAGKAAPNGGVAVAPQGGAGTPGMSDAQIALCVQYAAKTRPSIWTNCSNREDKELFRPGSDFGVMMPSNLFRKKFVSLRSIVRVTYAC